MAISQMFGSEWPHHYSRHDKLAAYDTMITAIGKQGGTISDTPQNKDTHTNMTEIMM